MGWPSLFVIARCLLYWKLLNRVCMSVEQLTLIKGPGKRGHIAADTNVSPFARERGICCGHKFCVRDTKNVSDCVQKHFVSATNVSQFAQPKKHHGQQCVLVCQDLNEGFIEINGTEFNSLSVPMGW